MFYSQRRYNKRSTQDLSDENARNSMVQRRLSDGAKRHLPVIRQGNMKSPTCLQHDEYISIPSNESTNRGHDIFSASKKDLARKNLMGYLYSRQPTISRSNSFIVGEKPFEPGLPTVKYKNTPKGFEKQKTLIFEQRRPPSLERKKMIDHRRSAGSRRPDSNKFSLPEIMRDIYSSAAKLDESPVEMDEDSNSSQNTRSIDVTKNIIPLNISNYHKSVKYYPHNHRPITPGLIDKLNKMRVSTKHRTEQWLRQMPEDPKLHQDQRSRGRPIDPSNRWIYTDNS